MASALADPETVVLNHPEAKIGLDTSASLEAITAPSTALNGASRSGGDMGFKWMEPPPGATPVAYSRVQIVVVNEYGGAGLPMAAQVFKLPEGDLLRCVYYSLTVSVGIRQDDTVVRWWLEPGGDDATLRTDALDLLQALHKPGWISVTDIPTNRLIGRARIDEAELSDSDLQEAHEFLERVAILEEWSGARIPVPEHVDADDATEIARAAAIVLARQVPLSLSRELIVTVAGEAPAQLDELRLPWSFAVSVLGASAPLGDATLSVLVRPVRVEPLDGDHARVHCVLSDDQPRRLMAHLEPPRTRSRILRRTLVAGAPVPPRPELLAERVDLSRLHLAEQFLADLDRELGPVPQALLSEIESQWPE